MFKRCYNKIVLDKEPSYRGCEVCENWCNYQNFAKWMNEQDYRKPGWQIDKDLIEFGNKLYCPEKCIFIPPNINKVLVTNKFNSSAGIKTRGNKYLVSMNIFGKNTYFGSYNTLEEAKLVYKKNKLEYIYKLAEKEGLPIFIVDLFESYFTNLQNQ